VEAVLAETGASSGAPGALPEPRSSFVGCEPSLQEIAELVADPAVAITTVTGRGGAGKTRAAIEVARRLEPSFPDGVTFVALAPVNEPDQLAPAIVQALGLIETLDANPENTLLDALRSRRGLLLLDNLEQILSAAPLIAQLAAANPAMGVLVTSRAPLRVSGERVVALPPLDLPPLEPTAGNPLELQQHSAVDLFCQRAQAVDHAFRLDGTNAAAVAAICQHLDGLPLAIELAAARSPVFAPGALLERLTRHGHDVLDLLARGPVDTEARHRSVRDTVAWSVDLLDGTAKTLFHRLGLLEGSWSLDDAEAICGRPPLRSSQTLDALASLVDFHLVDPIPMQRDDATARYSMLETVRAYACEQLDPAEQARLQAVHAAYFQTVATDAAQGLESADEQRWAVRIDHALVNLRAAHRHLLAEREPGAAVIAISLGWYWLNCGRFVEGRRWLADALATELPEGLAVAARMWIARYDLDRSGFGQSAAAARRNVAVLEEARASVDEHDDRLGWLRASDHLTHGLTLYEDTTRADEVAQASLDAWDPSLGAWWHAELLHRVAILAQRRDDITGGLAAARAGLAISVEHGFTRGEMRCRQAIVNLEGTTSDPREAIIDLRKVLVLSERLGDARAETTTCTMLASFCLLAGDLPEAAVWFHRAMARGREVGYWHAQRFALIGLTALAALRGDLARTARWHGANRPHLDVIRRGMPPDQFGLYEWIVDDVRTKLGTDRFEELAAAGEALDDATVLDECLAWSAAPSMAVGDEDAAPSTSVVGSKPTDALVDPLTARETDVLRLIAEGLTNAKIGVELGISPKTVMHHSGRIYQKLLVRGRAEAVALALRTGILTD
jgi:predicted ATPase/DNA-binding CsgD family transcriptional regulator